MTADIEHPVVSIDQVWTTYEGADCPVIQNISLKIRKGEFVVVGGPNGAGKTTLLEAICGLIPIIKGSLKVCGKDAVQDGYIVRRKVGYVIQNFDFHPFTPFTVEEVVHMGRYGKIGLFKKPTKRDGEISEQMLHRLGLSEMKNKIIGTLSGGQQQRTLIAHNLAKEPDLLLLDEPFSNLDIRSRDEVCSILCEIADRGIPVIIVSHAFDALPHRKIRVIVMNKGQITMDRESLSEDVADIVRSAPAV